MDTDDIWDHFQRKSDQCNLLTEFFTCRQHDRRVAVVGAADNSSDDHRAVGQLILLTRVQEGNLNILLVLCDVETFEADLRVKEMTC